MPMDETKACNCADCGKVLLVVYRSGQLKRSEVAGRIDDGIRNRPYCARCLKVRKQLEFAEA